MIKTPGLIKTGIKKIFYSLGYDCIISKRVDGKTTTAATNNPILLNIGAGDWECAGWTNLDHSSKTYSAEQSRHKYVEYDIRNDSLPFDDSSVDAIFCSHVIEHIETPYVSEMIKECYRVLRPGAVLRITCPDAEWMYRQTMSGNIDFWIRRKAELTQKGIDTENWNIINYLVREIAAPRVIGIGNDIRQDLDYFTLFYETSMESFFDIVTDGLVFDEQNVGNHINWWTVKKLSCLFREAGFQNIIESRCEGSISRHMISRAYFDTSGPWCSLYVEAIK